MKGLETLARTRERLGGIKDEKWEQKRCKK